MEKPSEYPSHIYEPIRVEIAGVYLKREFRKYFPSIRGEVWTKIDQDIDNWLSHPTYQGVNGPRDFWDGFNGFAAGFKLKIGFVDYLTAENIQWSKEKLTLDERVISSGPFEWISEELADGKQNANKLREFFSKNSQKADEMRQRFAEHAEASEERDQFPIIAIEQFDDGKTSIMIIDGNRRMLLSILNDKNEVEAYVGRYTTIEKTPQNFWLPTAFLMEIIERAKRIGTEETYQNTLALLKSYSLLSGIVKHELKTKALMIKDEFNDRLRKDLDLED